MSPLDSRRSWELVLPKKLWNQTGRKPKPSADSGTLTKRRFADLLRFSRSLTLSIRCSVIGSMAAGETRTFHCPQPMIGRYVTVYLPKTEYLQLCEVEVNALFPAPC
uniref:Fucolectin tachylectin-4 pentraxin-1 domain-containing protein n=1 Tax=Anguilla anguilla TaxID=7936 RepID=A0A0E9WYM0_ANGAN